MVRLALFASPPVGEGGGGFTNSHPWALKPSPLGDQFIAAHLEQASSTHNHVRVIVMYVLCVA